MDNIVIVEACRTAVGKFGGSLKPLSAADLAVETMKAAIERSGIDVNEIDEVDFGQCRQSSDASNIARYAALKAGIPERAPGNTVMCACASGMLAVREGIVILLSPVFFKEKLTAKKLICAAAAVVGMLFVSGMVEEAQLGAQDIKGILCGLGAAALYAAVIIMNKKVQVDDSYQKTMVQLAAAALVLAPRVITAGGGEIAAMNTAAVIMVLVVGVVHTGIAYVLYFGSMQSLKAQSVAVLSYIDPVFALILSAAVLHESLSPLGLAGAVLIIGSALVSETDFKKRA